jgi:SAM-dependent methyltransferase
MATAGLVDGKYYQVVAPRSVSERLMIAARDRIYADFMRCCRPAAADAILDVGVSDVVGDGANVLERKYPHQERITAAGLGEAAEFRAAFPGLAYVRIEADRPLPFADKSFAIATSNAVLEHVGSPEKQARFMRELMRVAGKVFVTVPHRYFPVEHHTAIPLLHFWDGTFTRACHWLNKVEWSMEENLILMSKRRLAALVPHGAAARIGHTGIKLGPFSSNLFLFVNQAGQAA